MATYPVKNKPSGILEKYREKTVQKEEQILHPKAAFSKNHNRYFGPENDHRLPYRRDVDRIVHSKAYARYIDKTQVVYLVENDHITHRGLHVQLVSNFSRGIAEILRLNLDLVEAISLGHDVGHPPFGHEGEDYLSKLSIEYGNGPFSHSLQSCRLLSIIEPLNLGLTVYDGFLCHDGGMKKTKLEPEYGKTWQDHFIDQDKRKMDPESNLIPGTLEGSLVKLCDTMSYIGRDIEDAISLGILKREQLPETQLGHSNKEILTHLASNIIEVSYGQNYITISDEYHDALKQLRKFNFENIYNHPKLKVESKKVERSYKVLFEILIDNLEKHKEESYIWENYLHNKSEYYLDNTSFVQMVVDYISGMTDNFFVRTLEKLVVPKRIEIF